MHMHIQCLILLKNLNQDIRVQVATTPEFPQIGEPSQFRIRVTEGFDYEEVDRFTMGIRIFFNGQQVDTIPPATIERISLGF